MLNDYKGADITVNCTMILWRATYPQQAARFDPRTHYGMVDVFMRKLEERTNINAMNFEQIAKLFSQCVIFTTGKGGSNAN